MTSFGPCASSTLGRPGSRTRSSRTSCRATRSGRAERSVTSPSSENAGGAPRTSAALGLLRELIDKLDAPVGFRDLLRAHPAAAVRSREELCVTFAELVHSAAGGPSPPPPELGALCLAVYLGADLLDNIADDELIGPWRGRAHEATLAGTSLLTVVPPLAIERFRELGASEHTLRGTAVELAQGLAAMASGQHAELRITGSAHPDPDRVREAAEWKTGGEFGLFAAVAARLAGCDEARIAAFRLAGRSFGAALQIVSDVRSALGDEPSDDLRNGRRTLPVAHALTATAGVERARLVEVLERCTRDAAAQPDARRALLAAGSLHHSMLVVEIYLRRSRRLLEEARAEGPGATGLVALLDEVSLLPAGKPDDTLTAPAGVAQPGRAHDS